MVKKSKAVVPLALLISLLLLAGCSGGPAAESQPPATTPAAETETPGAEASESPEQPDISMEMENLADAPPMFEMLMPAAPGTDVMENDKALIDISNKQDGYVMVKFLAQTAQQLKVGLKGPSGTTYYYSLKADGEYEVYPISDGSGSYEAAVYESVDGNRYSVALSGTFSVELADEFAPFLRPNQYVNYKEDNNAVKIAAELTGGLTAVPEKIAAVYNYVIANISYDSELAQTVQSGYLPDIDLVLQKGKGICFDYAAVMTAMLRSQGVPTKLVVGYTGNVYHAWINAYSDETGWMDNVIYFDGTSWQLMDPTFASSEGDSSEIEQYIGNASNYQAKYLY